MKSSLSLSLATTVFLLSYCVPVHAQKHEHNGAKFSTEETYVKPEYYTLGHARYRKTDDALYKLSGLKEQVSGTTPEERAWNFVMKNADKFKLKDRPENVLKHHFTYNTEEVSVVRYRQFYKDIPVDKNEIVVVMNGAGEVVQVTNNILPIPNTLLTTSRISEKAVLGTVLAHFNRVQLDESPKISRSIHIKNARTYFVYQVNVKLNEPYGRYTAYVDAQSGKIIEVKDELMYQCAQSGSGKGNVFNPDPISTSGAVYGTGGFEHGNNAYNPVLNAQMTEVRFPTGSFFGGQVYLQGSRAFLTNAAACQSPLGEWLNDRSHECFEEVMCYYHLDQNMCYYYSVLNGAGPYQFTTFDPFFQAVRFYVNSGYTISPGLYDPMSATIYIGTFDDGNGHIIEAGEDASVIIHELGHGVNDWMTQGGITAQSALSEGFADYWAQSYLRSFGLWAEHEDAYQRLSNWFMFTTEFPAQFNRTTGYDDKEFPSDLTGYGHTDGQFFSTAMMRIYDDIGKLKTDRIAVMGISFTDNSTTQQMAAEDVYQAAVILGYSTEELCIIYQHFKDIYNASFNPSQPGNATDYYIRDTNDDFGVEPNPTILPLWLSEDIWVRQQNDGLTVREHQNPIYGQTNYIYVRLRSRNCVPVEDGQLYVYFSKASTGLDWPKHWNDYYEITSNGPVLAGDVVANAPFSVPDDLRAGEERIIEIPWTNMPDPEDFDAEKHHFCILARLVSNQDPIGVEVSDLGVNGRNSNNVSWKNITILEQDPIVGPPSGSVFIRRGTQTWNEIRLNAPVLPRHVPCQTQGSIHIALNNNLKNVWESGGEQGSGFTQASDAFTWTAEEMALRRLNLQDTAVSYLLTATFEPYANARACVFDVVQTDTLGNLLGGERFFYKPVDSVGQRSQPSLQKQTNFSGLKIYPVPVGHNLNVSLSDNYTTKVVQVTIFDTFGKEWMLKSRKMLSDGEDHHLSFDVHTLPSGVYYLRVTDDLGHADILKFIKL